MGCQIKLILNHTLVVFGTVSEASNLSLVYSNRIKNEPLSRISHRTSLDPQVHRLDQCFLNFLRTPNNNIFFIENHYKKIFLKKEGKQ